jgi:integrase
MEAGSSIQPTGRLDFRKPTSGGNPTVLAWIALQGAPKTCAAEGGHSVPVGWHTLRHSFGTLMKANGEDIKTIQELLRHATFKVTADTYTQAVTPVKRDAQARIAKLIMADGSASKAITPTLQ